MGLLRQEQNYGMEGVWVILRAEFDLYAQLQWLTYLRIIIWIPFAKFLGYMLVKELNSGLNQIILNNIFKNGT